MRVDTAFLLGVLIGQWIGILALWSALLKLAKIFLSANGDKQSLPEVETLYLPAINIPNSEAE